MNTSRQDPQQRLAGNSRLECRICWYIYDPQLGDDIDQIAPGTPFSALPDSWRCPQCDADKQMFLCVEGPDTLSHHPREPRF